MSETPTDNSGGAPLKLLLFNPQRLSDADLERSFIARQAIFRTIMDDVAAEPADSRPQHHMIVGQRGMGKTTLLCRLAVELRRDPHRARFIPLTFPEELYLEIDRLSKFWLNCLDALADALEAEGASRESVAAIDAAVKEVERQAGEEKLAESSAREAFTGAWRRAARRPVLFIDNFNLLLKRLQAHDFELRGYFTASGAPLLIAACTDISERLEDYGAAFYDGFKNHWLRPLGLEEMREVVERLARETGRQDVLNRLGQEMPRLATLRDLTGGNPRTAVLLFDLFARGFTESAYEDLESLLDLITPLYQSRLEQLSDQAQVIVTALARQWRPVTVADLCDATGLANSSLSPQLGRLEDLGLVEKAEVFPSKRTGYQIAERFFNVWYLMRFSARRQRSSLLSLTRFLEAFHTPAERTIAARRLLSEPSLRREKAAYAMEVADSLSADPRLAHKLVVKAQLDLVEQMKGVRERIAEILEPADINPRMYEFADFKETLRQAIPVDSPVTAQEFADLVLGSPALLPSNSGSEGNTNRNTIASTRLTRERITKIADQLLSEVKKLNEWYHENTVTWLRTRLQHGLITARDNVDEINLAILSAERETELRIVLDLAAVSAKRTLEQRSFEKARHHLMPHATSETTLWLEWAYQLQTQFDRYTEAEDAYRKAIALDPASASAWYGLGNLLTDHLGRHSEAEDAYRKAIALDPEFAYPWYNLGNLLTYDLERHSEAEEAYRKAIALDPEDAATWNGLGYLLTDHLGRHSEAEEAYRKAIALDPEFAYPWYNLGNLLTDHLGRHSEAEEAYRKAIALDPKDSYPWNNLGCLLTAHLGRYSEAEEAYRKAIALDPEDTDAWNSLGNLLADYLGRFDDAREAFQTAINLDPANDSARHNLTFLLRDFLGDAAAAREVLARCQKSEICKDTEALHNALSAAYEDNWGMAAAALRQALEAAGFTLPPYTRDDWFRASAVLLHLGFGEKLVALLEEQGADIRMLPWFAAVRAHTLGDRRHLLNLAVEARPAAEKIYDEIQKRRERLANAWPSGKVPKP